MNQGWLYNAASRKMLCKDLVINTVVSDKFIKTKDFISLFLRDKVGEFPLFAHFAIITNWEFTVNVFGAELVSEVFQIKLHSLEL
jgi:hypothetical protein